MSKYHELYGKLIARDGVTPIPMALFRYQKELNISATEMIFICNLLTYRWTVDKNPYPSFKRLSEATGLSQKTLHTYKNSLIAKGYLKVLNRVDDKNGKLSNAYDLSPLLQAIEDVITHTENNSDLDSGIICDSETSATNEFTGTPASIDDKISNFEGEKSAQKQATSKSATSYVKFTHGDKDSQKESTPYVNFTQPHITQASHPHITTASHELDKDKLNNKKQQQYFLSSSSNNNSHDENPNPGEADQQQILSGDQGTSPDINNNGHLNNQDIEKEAQNIRHTLMEITGVEVDEKLIFLLASLPLKNRDDIIDVVCNYLQKNDVNSIDGLIAAAIRENWRPGKSVLRTKKIKKSKKRDKFCLLYQSGDDK